MDKVWYYRKKDNQKYGPYTDEELIRLIRLEIINAEDEIWMVDLETWVNLGNSIYSCYIPGQNNNV